MSNPSRRSPQLRKLARPIIAAGLVAGGLFQLVPPVLSLGTAANTLIKNTATATYTDPDNNPLTTISNEVTVTVAEIAGLTNIAQTPVDPNGGSVISDDFVQFPFSVTNTGNAPTDIFVPLSTAIDSNELDKDTGTYLDLDGNGTPEYFLSDNGDLLAIGTPDPLTGAYQTTGSAITQDSTTPTFVTDEGWIIPDIDPDTTIIIIVQGQVSGTEIGDEVTVTLGSTNSNDSSNPDSQNQPDDADGTNLNEIRTINPDAVNGDREAADTSAPLIVGQEVPKPLALATVLKSVGNINPGPTGAIDDDVITYNLSFRVESELPLGYTGNFTPAGLKGTAIDVDGNTGQYVLVSDAKPENAEFVDPATSLPVAPFGWTVVYTTDALTVAAPDANWSTTVPTVASSITRIGFIYNTTTNAPIPTGTTVTGFTLQATNATTSTVRNLAQLFGSTFGDPDNNIVFDESGDQNPNNFLGDTPSNNDPYGDYDPVADTGDPAAEDGSDPNDGTPNDGGGNDTEKGEPNELELIFIPTTILNGPLNQPAAIGPEGTTNDDFVEKSIIEPVTLGGTINDPAPVTFGNSVANGTSVAVSNVVLRPIAPALAAQVCAACDYDSFDADGNPIVIPTGTVVTITLPVQPGVAAQQTATYNWDGSAFNLTSLNQVSIPTLAAGQELDYQVTVDLPSADAFAAYSIPVAAYINNDTNTTFDIGPESANSNIKIDRLYAGYLKLTKEVQVIYADTTVPDSGFTDDITSLTRQPGPGDTLEYRITYENIATSATGSGTGNILLPANNVIITENGLGDDPNAPDNNWAVDNDGNSIIDTSNVIGSAAGIGTIQFFNNDPASLGTDLSGTTAATDVTQYLNNVGTVTPGTSDTFTFQRTIN